MKCHDPATFQFVSSECVTSEDCNFILLMIVDGNNSTGVSQGLGGMTNGTGVPQACGGMPNGTGALQACGGMSHNGNIPIGR